MRKITLHTILIIMAVSLTTCSLLGPDSDMDSDEEVQILTDREDAQSGCELIQ